MHTHTHTTHTACGLQALDLTKAFDRVEYDPLFTALEQGVPKAYIAPLEILYQQQCGFFHSGETLAVQRGVKQGDVISPILFNAALESTMTKCKTKLQHHGVNIGAGDQQTADMQKSASLQGIEFEKEIEKLRREQGEMMRQLKSQRLGETPRPRGHYEPGTEPPQPSQPAYVVPSGEREPLEKGPSSDADEECNAANRQRPPGFAPGGPPGDPSDDDQLC